MTCMLLHACLLDKKRISITALALILGLSSLPVGYVASNTIAMTLLTFLYIGGISIAIYLKEMKYKDTANHVSQHTMFVDKIKKIADEFKSGDASISIDLVDFLKEVKYIHNQEKK